MNKSILVSLYLFTKQRITENNKTQPNGFQYMFSMAPSVITIIKSAEPIRKNKDYNMATL